MEKDLLTGDPNPTTWKTYIAVGDVHGTVTKVGAPRLQKVRHEGVVQWEGQSDEGPHDDQQRR